MRIRRKFLQLTSYTYPYGKEGFLKCYLPKGYKTDQFGNFFIEIGQSTTMFTCHLDTASFNQEKVKHVQTGNMITSDGTTILGADDKAGMTILLYMIEKQIPGLYYFFLGEEVGCIGSGKLSGEWEKTEFASRIKKVVSFDRRGTHSIITHQLGSRCCSEEFATELAIRLNTSGGGLKMKLDDTGIFTDSAKFISIVPECTNISVGYYNEHTTRESQDIEFLQRLCKSVCQIDWETLPVVRNPEDSDYDLLDEDDDFDDDTDVEEEFTSSYFSYFKSGDKTKKYYIAKKKIEKEIHLLKEWVKTNGWSDTDELVWNGNSLNVKVEGSNKLEFLGNRYELMEFIPELGSVPNKYLKSSLDDKVVS